MTNKNNIFYFATSISGKCGSIQKPTPPRAYELESLKDENKKIIIRGGQFGEANYPFKIKRNCSTLGGVIEISRQAPLHSFVPDDSIRDHLFFNAGTL